MSTTGCTTKCWAASPCATCGKPRAPRGRSIASLAPVCRCQNDEDNPRHLWDEHDPGRELSDPEGWARHQEECVFCGAGVQPVAAAA